jgi:hypothetical protein
LISRRQFAKVYRGLAKNRNRRFVRRRTMKIYALRVRGGGAGGLQRARNGFSPRVRRQFYETHYRREPLS